MHNGNDMYFLERLKFLLTKYVKATMTVTRWVKANQLTTWSEVTDSLVLRIREFVVSTAHEKTIKPVSPFQQNSSCLTYLILLIIGQSEDQNPWRPRIAGRISRLVESASH